MPEPFSYDLVEYPTFPVPTAHPDRLFTQARLFGLTPAPVERCRYLEVGCGSGANLLAAAAVLPGAEFVGIDLAAREVERGQAVADELGLTNVRLHHADLTAWEPDGAFDYVAAHGVYSWVPAAVRDRLIALLRRALGPDGVGYVSYNALPGCHIRRVVWDLLRFHTEDAPDAAATLDRAAEALRFLAAGQEGQPEPVHRLMVAEAEAVLARPDPRSTFHDDLSADNDPVYFLDFARHAAGHGLRFLAEAELVLRSESRMPAGVVQALAALGAQDPLLREQYRDFLRVRRFRTTLLVPDGRTPAAEPLVERVGELLASARLTRVGPLDLSPGVPAEFVGPKGDPVVFNDPLSKLLAAELADRAPDRVPVAELHQLAADRLEAAAEAVNQAVLDGASVGLLFLHGFRPPLALAPGERPAVSPLARLQAARGWPVSTLIHTTLELADPAAQALLPLLDGTRDRAELAAAVAAAVPGLGGPAELADRLATSLGRLARAGMLVA